MDLQDSVQRSLQNPAEKILQIFTDSQRLKTWDLQPIQTECPNHYIMLPLDIFNAGTLLTLETCIKHYQRLKLMSEKTSKKRVSKRPWHSKLRSEPQGREIFFSKTTEHALLTNSPTLTELRHK